MFRIDGLRSWSRRRYSSMSSLGFQRKMVLAYCIFQFHAIRLLPCILSPRRNQRFVARRKIGVDPIGKLERQTPPVRLGSVLAWPGTGRVTRNHQHRPCLKNFANQLQEFVWKFEVFGQVHVELPRLWPWQSQPFNVANAMQPELPLFIS